MSEHLNDFDLSGLEIPPNGSVWIHYKGTKYIVKGLCIREWNDDLCVLYTELGSTNAIPWCRPLNEWLQFVQVGDDGMWVRRFRQEPIQRVTCY